MRTLSTLAVLSLSLVSADAGRVLADHGDGPGHGHLRLVLDCAYPDWLSASVAPGSFPAAFPAGIGLLTEPAIQRGLILACKLRDLTGNVVGFATEQADLDFAAAVSTATWTLTLPGRGTVFLSQREDLALLVQILGEMQSTGQLERTYSPPLQVVTTIGTGEVVGGTGDFAHAHGTFREVDLVERISLLTGSLDVTDRVEIDLHGVHEE